METKNMATCNNCGVSADQTPSKKLVVCGGCKPVSYCCRDCQLSDRPSHNATCRALARATQDSGPSVLDLYINRQYDAALARAKKYPDELHACDTRDVESLGETVVHKAGRKSFHYDLLRDFLALQPICASRETRRGLLPIHLAGVNKNVGGVRILHDTYPEGVTKAIGRGSPHAGGTALHITVLYAEFHSHGQLDELLEIVSFLLEKNPAALLVRNSWGRTPLEIVLIRHGFEISCQDQKAVELASVLKEKTLQLEGGEAAVQEAEAIDEANTKDGETPWKIETVMECSSCSRQDAVSALRNNEHCMMNATIEVLHGVSDYVYSS